ncbi:carbon storage regulator CsrA [Candidatus Odyssella acanthamoebae]|uniref:carbon storage regulator CsrA n=1 Tax=Candidatus Odyssella acanthamoebae TaxID=91604 RepID=UPI00094AC1C6|nr:carbon storage regulator CsrA [Candidatus Paracaedibacter acanthamoebae]
MLFLTRKIGESIIIDDEITLTISEIRGSIVKLSFDYPKTSRILRKEIHDRIQQENKNAAAQADKIKQYLSTTHSSEIESSSDSQESSLSSDIALDSDRRASR